MVKVLFFFLMSYRYSHQAVANSNCAWDGFGVIAFIDCLTDRGIVLHLIKVWRNPRLWGQISTELSLNYCQFESLPRHIFLHFI